MKTYDLFNKGWKFVVIGITLPTVGFIALTGSRGVAFLEDNLRSFKSYLWNNLPKDMERKEFFIKDVNNDGLADLIIQYPYLHEEVVLIGRGNGMYEETVMRLDNGYPFYYGQEGYYTPWNEYYPYDQFDKLFSTSLQKSPLTIGLLK